MAEGEQECVKERHEGGRVVEEGNLLVLVELFVGENGHQRTPFLTFLLRCRNCAMKNRRFLNASHIQLFLVKRKAKRKKFLM